MSATPVKKVPIHLQSSQNRLLIKNGKIVNANGITDNDVFIEDGIIKQLGRNLIIPGGTRIIDARGNFVIPGGIDPHTHLELKLMGATSVDDFYQGTKAAIAGGTTMIMDFVIPDKGESLLETYQVWREKADEKVCCDYGLHVAVTWWSEETTRKEMEILCKEHGINSFKMFMAYKGALMVTDPELYNIFEVCKDVGALAMVHAENGDIIVENTKRLLANGVTGPEGHELSRPEEVEAEAVNRAAVIASQVSCPLYVVHVMSESAGNQVSRIRQLKQEGESKLIGETLACALGTTWACCTGKPWSFQAAHILSPPLRPKESTPTHLMHLLQEDGLSLVGSDNCTFTLDQKKELGTDFSKIPNGVNGVEDRMSVVWEKGVETGIIDVTRFVEITSTNAAKIFNIYPQKGCLAVGSDADIVIWNPRKTRVISAKTHHQANDFNIFEGMECHGVPEYVIVNGRVCVDEGELKAVQGFGKFVPTPTHSPYLYGSGEQDGEAELNGVPQPVEVTVDDVREKVKNMKVNGAESVKSVRSSSASIFGDCDPQPFTTRKQMRQEGQRNLQDSTFSISSDLDDGGHRSSIRVKNPPGGKSSGGFWGGEQNLEDEYE